MQTSIVKSEILHVLVFDLCLGVLLARRLAPAAKLRVRFVMKSVLHMVDYYKETESQRWGVFVESARRILTEKKMNAKAIAEKEGR